MMKIDLNSSPPSATYRCQRTGSSLVQIMAWRLFGAKPLPELMLAYCQPDSWEEISVKLESEFFHFHSRKCIWKCRLPKWQPFCPEGDELNGSLNSLIFHPTGQDAFYASAFRRRRHYVFGLSIRPSVRPSVRPSEAWNTLFWPVHGFVGPPDQPLPFYGMSVRPSVCPSVRLSVRPSVRRGFRAFAGECMEGLAWNFACWCILTIFRTG